RLSLTILADADLRSFVHVLLENRLSSGIPYHAILHDIAGRWVTVKLSEIPTSFCPLACRVRTIHSQNSQAGTDRSAFVKDLRNSKQGFLTEPWKPVVAEKFRSVRPVCGQRTVIDLAAW